MSGMTDPSYNQDSLIETIYITLEFLSDIISDIQFLPEFSAEKEFHWNHQVQRITHDVSRFVQITTLLAKALVTKKGVTIPDIKHSHIHLLFVLKGMNQSQLKNDYIALEDLIKYELKDNLTQWKIDLIPQIKKHLAPSLSM
jgi:hypothetical protein